MWLREDRDNHLIKPSVMHSLSWEGGYEPWAAREPITCVRCRGPILKSGLAWYHDQYGPYCTRCRNAATAKNREGIGG